MPLVGRRRTCSRPATVPQVHGYRDLHVRWSPIVAREVPSVGTFQLDLRFWGDGTSLYEVGLALLREAEL